MSDLVNWLTGLTEINLKSATPAQCPSSLALEGHLLIEKDRRFEMQIRRRGRKEGRRNGEIAFFFDKRATTPARPYSQQLVRWRFCITYLKKVWCYFHHFYKQRYLELDVFRAFIYLVRSYLELNIDISGLLSTSWNYKQDMRRGAHKLLGTLLQLTQRLTAGVRSRSH